MHIVSSLVYILITSCQMVAVRGRTVVYSRRPAYPFWCITAGMNSFFFLIGRYELLEMIVTRSSAICLFIHFNPPIPYLFIKC